MRVAVCFYASDEQRWEGDKKRAPHSVEVLDGLVKMGE